MKQQQKQKQKGRRVTRKRTRGAGGAEPLTVEALHASFEKLDRGVRAHIKNGRTDKELAAAIQQGWMEQFHRPLSPAAVKGLVRHYRAVLPVRMTRKAARGGQQQQGGAWEVAQGTTDAVYGRFPTEIGSSSAALSALDATVPQPSWAPSGTPSGTQSGGSMLGSFLMGHMPSSIPHNALESTVSTIQGHPITNPSADPVSAAAAGIARPMLQPYDAHSITQISTIPRLGP